MKKLLYLIPGFLFMTSCSEAPKAETDEAVETPTEVVAEDTEVLV